LKPVAEAFGASPAAFGFVFQSFDAGEPSVMFVFAGKTSNAKFFAEFNLLVQPPVVFVPRKNVRIVKQDGKVRTVRPQLFYRRGGARRAAG
jgi:hypothetical protein